MKTMSNNEFLNYWRKNGNVANEPEELARFYFEAGQECERDKERDG